MRALFWLLPPLCCLAGLAFACAAGVDANACLDESAEDEGCAPLPAAAPTRAEIEAYCVRQNACGDQRPTSTCIGEVETVIGESERASGCGAVLGAHRRLLRCLAALPCDAEVTSVCDTELASLEAERAACGQSAPAARAQAGEGEGEGEGEAERQLPPGCALFLHAGDGCDCGCGTDSDCDGSGCSTPGCSAAACAYCYDGDGTAVPCI